LTELIQKTSRKGLVWATNIYNTLIDVAQDAMKICFSSTDATAKSFRIMALYDSYTTQIASVESQIHQFIKSQRVSDEL
ncbi:MAG TPA: hypothetical protein GX707_13300, partial [Epulopiscium sp.]|nr:hypothetical protein [Candidatus Epulonipiscium sp.]